MQVVPISTANIVVFSVVFAITTLLKNVAVVCQLEASAMLSFRDETFIHNLPFDLFHGLIRYGP
jgi:hypothetical protein